MLDIILKHSINKKLPTETSKPSLNYKFIDEFKNSYEDLKTKYNSIGHPFNDTKFEGWCDDFRLLFHLSQYYKFYKVKLFVFYTFLKYYKALLFFMLIYKCQKVNLSLCPI